MPGLAIATACLTVACSSPHRTTGVLKPAGPTSQARPAMAPSTSQVTWPSGVAPGTTVVATLAAGGANRSYRVHVPASSHPGKPSPLVMVLHGANGNAGRVELRYHWDSLSDRDGFVVVYPQGLLDQWNAALDPRAADDVSFLTALIDHLVGELSLDRGRVYVAGMSNGAAMAYRLACVMAAPIAAFASVEGANPGCRALRPVSLVAVHGVADTQVSFASARQSVDAWRGDDGCAPGAQAQRTGSVTRTVWAPCATGTTVELFGVDGGGHEWPGSWPPLPNHDPPSPDLDATQVIWDFFRQVSR
jgi:polyhydroxybutyrate depolymerase